MIEGALLDSDWLVTRTIRPDIGRLLGSGPGCVRLGAIALSLSVKAAVSGEGSEWARGSEDNTNASLSLDTFLEYARSGQLGVHWPISRREYIVRGADTGGISKLDW